MHLCLLYEKCLSWHLSRHRSTHHFQKNDIFKVHASENFEKRTIQKINKLSKNKGIIETKGREECPEGTVDDCSGDGDCCPEEWIGDGYTDCEDQEYGCDLTCYENDGGDCVDNPEDCPEGTVWDCAGDGDCCPEEWIGDGYTDCEDQEYGCDLTCYENDGGDCVDNPEDCPEGTVWDCSGDGDCCPSEWIGDGYSDCEDQEYGCDLTCYENDGGDCVDNPEDCPEGTVWDCSGDGDCCPSEWIGDGYSDCEDQQYGCDLTCYENDGGDCESDGRGDVSLDREINILDVVSLPGFVINIAQPSDNEFWAGDINQDRTLDILDIVLLIDIIFQN